MSLAKEKLIVALDVDNLEKAEDLVQQLKNDVDIFKVGLELFLNTGGQAVDMIGKYNKKVFLDLKFHDISNTVAQAARFAKKQNIFMFNVHSGGGKQMMNLAFKELEGETDRPLLIGVTVLTSLKEEMVAEEMQCKLSLADLVVHWAKLTKEAGLDGVVASPWEIEKIKAACGSDFKVICPGIRPSWAAANDQARIYTPAEAIRAGADFLVVGRPIIKAEDPKIAARRVLAEIEEELANGR